MNRLIAVALVVALSGTAHASDILGGISVDPTPPTTGVEESIEASESDDLEVALDWATFERAGYVTVQFPFPGDERAGVLSDLVAPDYEARTGIPAPADASFEYMAVNLTGGDFNDVLLMSRLPGDCGPNGCRTQVWRTVDGSAWEKVADFVAMGLAYRLGNDAVPTRLAAIGDEVAPSYTLSFDGSRFAEEAR